jgi:hypothetical protein
MNNEKTMATGISKNPNLLNLASDAAGIAHFWFRSALPFFPLTAEMMNIV